MVFHQCASDGLGLNVRADFALAFWMVHEVRDQAGLLAEVNAALLPGGKLLIAEPRMHVPERDFENTVSLAQGAGFTLELRPEIPMSRAALLRA
jgi:SAM-dependent methyltransferase